jgi:hypothetical protein
MKDMRDAESCPNERTQSWREVVFEVTLDEEVAKTILLSRCCLPRFVSTIIR